MKQVMWDNNGNNSVKGYKKNYRVNRDNIGK